MSQSPEDIKEKVREQFGRTAWEYVRSESHAKGPDLGSFIDWLRPEKSWLCLDIATGGGMSPRHCLGMQEQSLQPI